MKTKTYNLLSYGFQKMSARYILLVVLSAVYIGACIWLFSFSAKNKNLSKSLPPPLITSTEQVAENGIARVQLTSNTFEWLRLPGVSVSNFSNVTPLSSTNIDFANVSYPDTAPSWCEQNSPLSTAILCDTAQSLVYPLDCSAGPVTNAASNFVLYVKLFSPGSLNSSCFSSVWGNFLNHVGPCVFNNQQLTVYEACFKLNGQSQTVCNILENSVSDGFAGVPYSDVCVATLQDYIQRYSSIAEEEFEYSQNSAPPGWMLAACQISFVVTDVLFSILFHVSCFSLIFYIYVSIHVEDPGSSGSQFLPTNQLSASYLQTQYSYPSGYPPICYNVPGNTAAQNVIDVVLDVLSDILGSLSV